MPPLAFGPPGREPQEDQEGDDYVGPDHGRTGHWRVAGSA